MKIILTQEHETLGQQGEIVTVKDGYARNFLIPRGMARVATAGTIRAVEEERRQASRKLAAAAADARRVAAQLETVEVVIPARVGEENRIFGSITSAQLADALTKMGFDVDRRRIELDEEIRTTGVYGATARLHREVSASFKVRVVPEGGEAI